MAPTFLCGRYSDYKNYKVYQLTTDFLFSFLFAAIFGSTPLNVIIEFTKVEALKKFRGP